MDSIKKTLIKTNKNVNDIYKCAESMISNLISTESNFKELYNLRDVIYEDIINNKFEFNSLSRSGDVYIHLVNVAIISGLISKNISLNRKLIKISILGGLLHDIGKFYIPERIINKPGRLSRFEYIAMSSHEIIGNQIVSLFCQSEKVSDIISFHHTYIKNLQSPVSILNMNMDDKLLMPLICSIADITDAIISVRPYKERLSLKVARNDLHIKGIADIDNIFSLININVD